MVEAGDAFVARFRRLDRVARCLVRAPESVLVALARRLCQHHPLALSGEQYRAGLRRALRVSDQTARAMWRRHLLREMIGFFHYRRYRRIDQHWLARQVRIDDASGGWRPADGGLVLTYHVPEWHLLCSVLGLLGGRVYAVAQAPDSVPLAPELRAYLDDLHEATSRHFRGGGYLFVRDGREALAQAEARLREGALVVALTDQQGEDPGTERAGATLFGRRVCPRAGVARSALAVGSPIIAASIEFDPEDRRYRVALRSAAAATLEGVLGTYFGHLEDWLRARADVWGEWREFETFAGLRSENG